MSGTQNRELIGPSENQSTERTTCARSIGCCLVTWAFLCCPAVAVGQNQPAPFYSLPEDGSWVEYDWTFTDAQGKVHGGLLRISCVGKERFDGKICRWVELKRGGREGTATPTKIRKLLVAEAGREVPAGPDRPPDVVLGFSRDESDGPITRLGARRLVEVAHLGFEAEQSGLREEAKEEKIQTPLGEFVARHVSMAGRTGQRRLEYHGWLTANVPFGWAKMEIREPSSRGPARVLYSVTAGRRGTGARSELAVAVPRKP